MIQNWRTGQVTNFMELLSLGPIPPTATFIKCLIYFISKLLKKQNKSFKQTMWIEQTDAITSVYNR